MMAGEPEAARGTYLAMVIHRRLSALLPNLAGILGAGLCRLTM